MNDFAFFISVIYGFTKSMNSKLASSSIHAYKG